MKKRMALLLVLFIAGVASDVQPTPLMLPIGGDLYHELPVWTIVTVSLSCEGHPHTLEWEALSPSAIPGAGPGFRCWETGGTFANPCVGDVVLDECGVWTIAGGCFYSHIVDGQPYANYAEEIVTVFGCSIFVDGFETGDTTNWTMAVP